MGTARPNILLVVLDTARADAFEPWGAPVGASPTTAQLASAGWVAPDVMATSSWTVPSHASMFTGLLPRAIGLGRQAGNTPAGYRETMLAHGERSLPTVLRDQGYRTAGISANLWISEQSGFATGFDSFRNVQTTRRGQQSAEDVRGRLRWRLEVLRARADDGAEQVERLLDEQVRSRSDDPFFWFVNLVECHSPYLPPAPYDDSSRRERWRSARDAAEHQTFHAFTVASLNGYDGSDEALGRMRHLYSRAVLLLDDWLARVLDRFDAAGILDETLVIVTSDHGENFGECGLMGHTYSLDHRLIHVPLVAMGPGADSLASMRSLVELPSRVASVAGLARHPWSAVAPVPGVAVSQLDAFLDPGDDLVPETVRDLDLTTRGAERLVTSLTCAVDGRWKLVRRGDREELVDVHADPLEASPVDPADAPDDAPLAALRAALAAAASSEVQPGEVVAPSVADSDDMEAQLRLLGYL